MLYIASTVFNIRVRTVLDIPVAVHESRCIIKRSGCARICTGRGARREIFSRRRDRARIYIPMYIIINLSWMCYIMYIRGVGTAAVIVS